MCETTPFVNSVGTQYIASRAQIEKACDSLRQQGSSPSDLLQHVRPYHEVLFSSKPHRPGCHQWKPMHLQVHDEIRELQPDVIVERHLDAKYYQHPPDQVQEMSEYNSNATYLADSDQIMTLNAMETDDISILASLRDNLQELEHSVPEWEPETQSIHPKWLEHHESGPTPCQRSKLSSMHGGSRQ